MPPRSFACLLFSLVAMLAACAAPPSKEMDQAQGAIDGARAAGADQYAATELKAAADSLRGAEEAVTQKDYRLALNHAIESRIRAQEAAKVAVDARVKARGDAERAVAEADTLLTHALERLKDPAVARLPRRALQEPRAVIEQAEKTMQEARAALAADNYAQAVALTAGLAPRLQAALSAIDAAVAETPARRRR